MSVIEPNERRRAELCEWFAQSPGRSLLAVEAHALRAVWPSLFSKVAVQLGCAGPVDLLEACNAQVRAVRHSGRSGVMPTTRFFATSRYTAPAIGHQRSPALSRKCSRSIVVSLASGGR